MLAPAAAYARYAPAFARDGWWTALRRPLFVAILQGVAFAVFATETVAAPVVVSLTLCWAYTIVVQVLSGAALIASAPYRDVSFSRALDLLFLGHAPWSLWLLLYVAAHTFAGVRSSWPLLLSILIPAVLTPRILVAFSQHVLRLDRRTAVRRVTLHQAITWALILGYGSAAVALWPRLVGALGR